MPRIRNGRRDSYRMRYYSRKNVIRLVQSGRACKRVKIDTADETAAKQRATFESSAPVSSNEFEEHSNEFEEQNHCMLRCRQQSERTLVLPLVECWRPLLEIVVDASLDWTTPNLERKL